MGGGGLREGGGTLYLCEWAGGGGGWSGTQSAGLGESDGEQVELVDMGLNWPEPLPELQFEELELAELHPEQELELDELKDELEEPLEPDQLWVVLERPEVLVLVAAGDTSGGS